MNERESLTHLLGTMAGRMLCFVWGDFSESMKMRAHIRNKRRQYAFMKKFPPPRIVLGKGTSSYIESRVGMQ